MNDIIVDVENVSKCYNMYKKSYHLLIDKLIKKTGKKYNNEFWALKDISFSVKKGERFGIIGKNGSGKSTLLQILAGIFQPTKGNIKVHGKVAALLELGSGFNPEFTGRENIYINASILGLKKEQIEQQIEEIIEFADIGEFIDRPVKTYSSGMFVRLAFAVSSGVDADILIIDEALAVGDVFFRQKCYDRLNRLRNEGKTVILVSHAMGEVEQFCDRTLLIDEGQQIFIGETTEAVKRYYLIDTLKNTAVYSSSENKIDLKDNYKDQNKDFPNPKPNSYFDLSTKNTVGDGKVECLGVALCDNDGNAKRVFYQGENAYFYCDCIVRDNIEVPLSGITIYNDKNIVIHGKNTLQTGCKVPQTIKKGTRILFRQEINLDIHTGDFTFEVGIGSLNSVAYLKKNRIPHDELESQVLRHCVIPKCGFFSVLMKKNDASVALPFHGISDLEGEIQFKFIC